MAHWHKHVAVNATVVCSNYYVSLFSFPRSGNKAKRGVEFRHSTRNDSKTLEESGERNVLALGSFCLPCLPICWIQNVAKKITYLNTQERHITYLTTK